MNYIFENLLERIKTLSSRDDSFIESSNKINEFIKDINKSELIILLKEVGAIPESIEHDSTEEKLFSKASDSILSRAFIEIGLKSKVLTERADSADIL